MNIIKKLRTSYLGAFMFLYLIMISSSILIDNLYEPSMNYIWMIIGAVPLSVMLSWLIVQSNRKKIKE